MTTSALTRGCCSRLTAEHRPKNLAGEVGPAAGQGHDARRIILAAPDPYEEGPERRDGRDRMMLGVIPADAVVDASRGLDPAIHSPSASIPAR